MKKEDLDYYERLARKVRKKLIESAEQCNGEGYWGGYLSCIEILTIIMGKNKSIFDKNLGFSEKDKFYLSKGHSAKAFYTLQYCLGVIDDEIYSSFGQKGSPMSVLGEYCPEYNILHSGGSLGLGLPVAVGVALLAKRRNYDYTVYVLVGDGEFNEGSNWEAVMTAAKYHLDNLCCIIDNNRYQSDGACDDIMPWGDIKRKIEAFGGHAEEVDGHSCADLYETIFLSNCCGKPRFIVANTIKGKGVSFMEGNNAWHHTRLVGKDYDKALSEVIC